MEQSEEKIKSGGFKEIYDTLDFDETAVKISGSAAFHNASNRSLKNIPEGLVSRYEKTDVRNALAKESGTLSESDFQALLSPSADDFLEEMAVSARNVTRRRFGNVMQIYAPLYLSSECRSTCTYCGFSHENSIRRKTLTLDELKREADFLYDEGIRHVLLLTGEDYHNTPFQYISDACGALSERFQSIGLEVYPLKEDQYSELKRHGLDSLTVYQETYDKERYSQVHLRGMKKNLYYRLDCPDRGGRAGLRKISIGSLLGLSDPSAEVFMAGIHAKYLMKNYWQSQINISLPRLRPASGFEDVPGIDDKTYVKYLCALRLFLPDAGIILSTREAPRFRNHMSKICITMMSAGSKTDPGGYTIEETDGQFEIEDKRSVEQVTQMLIQQNMEPVFTDWSSTMK